MQPRFRIFTGERDCPDFSAILDPWGERVRTAGPVQTAPLVARLKALKTLLEAPTERAKRLAFHLARRRPGPLLAPGRHADVPRRWGTELSMLYEGMAESIRKLSQARPPPLDPVAKPPPRIRLL
ncbi:MAG: hypothetical protein AAFZ91_05975 [Pseudomonadota bacterium]